MRLKCSIGFFAGVFFLSALYCLSDAWFREEKGTAVRAVTQREEEKVYAYYLVGKGDRILVYKGDRETLFMETFIPLSSLPAEQREALLEGKPVCDEEELFGFLENYSS